MAHEKAEPIGASTKRLNIAVFAFWIAGLGIVCVLPLAQQANAEIFENQYLRFQLPDGWHCHLEEAVFVCEPPLPKGHKSPMIIILTAKIAGDTDTFPGFMEYLGKNRSVNKGSSLIDGPRIDNEIGKVKWVEATHFESELPGFYTIYLATTWEGLSILVTFSGHQTVYPKFREMVLPCIQSLEVKQEWKKHSKTK